MTKETLFKGVEIEQLIPQRSPIVMVDAFYEANETSASTGLTIANDNFFCRDGQFTEPGLIEHIAQSASAFAGYSAFKEGEPAPVGYIGEVKKLKILSLPAVGSTLTTSIKIISEVLNITLLKAETKIGEQVVANCQMKISIGE